MLNALRYFGIGYAAYIALSLLVIFPLLNIMTPKLVQSELGRKFQASIIIFNPFTVALNVRQGKFYNPDDSLFLSWNRLGINLSISSLWSQGIVFDAIELNSLHAEIDRAVDGTFNFDDLLASSDETTNAKPGPAIPGITIGDLTLHSQEIRFTDHTRESKFVTYIDGIGISVKDISTVYESEEPYSLHARAEGGGELHWAGQISLPSGTSSGTLSLDTINVATLSRFIEPWVNFRMPAGRLSIGGEYAIDWRDDLLYSIDKGSVKLTNLAIAPLNPQHIPDTSVALDSMFVDDISIDSAKQSITANSLTLLGLAVSAWSESDKISLVDMFAAKNDSPDNEPANTDDGAPSPWHFVLRNTEIRAASAQLKTPYTSPPKLSVNPIDISVGQLSWPPEQASPFDISLAINTHTSVAIDGSVNLATGDGALHYALTALPLSLLSPNLPEVLDATVDKGMALAEGNFTLAGFNPSQVSSDGSITDFSINVAEAENAITHWEAVSWKGLSVNLIERAVGLENLTINGYSGRLHIHSDGTINTQKLLRERYREDASPTTATAPSETEPAWSFSIPNIAIADSKIDFMDESLPIQFRTVIGQLNGNVVNLSSLSEMPASIKLAGLVDGYAPVLLQGSASLFNKAPELDLGLIFTGMDIAGLTPYSGNYAGYAIDRGILNLDLNYTLKDSKLNGANEVIIEKLKLGNKVDSEQAVDLPLGLAIALLTDLNGVIDIDLPVSGDVDNPDFSIGSIVFGAFINLITEAVTSPFSLLAGLMGSEDDLQRVYFDPGSAELNERITNQLNTLSDALHQRPALILTIEGRLQEERDTQMLARQVLNESLMADGLSAEQLEQRTPPWQSAIAARYSQLSGSVNGDTLSPELQYQRLLASMTINRERLTQLLRERAAAVKRYLVTQANIEADRAVIESAVIDDDENTFSGVELGISN